MRLGWFFNDELSPATVTVDSFADSKFSVDKWGSFAREIIQNSLDARDDYSKPVKVVFDLNKSLCLSDIPGGQEIKMILSRCKENATNRHTQSAYAKGLEILSKEKVYCLKISDYNTRGVASGRDGAWGALVFDEGKSVKLRPGSAGSHGVGKKVPFIISTCNTVFYSTKNKYMSDGVEKSESLFQGKSVLINWLDHNGIKKSSKGWFGTIDETGDYQNRINPIESTDFSSINPYFLRTESNGTDVIIVGANVYDNEESVKRVIISAILENFFIAIMQSHLEINVLGEEINSSSFYGMLERYYTDEGGAKNDLVSCCKVYDQGCKECIPIKDGNGDEVGKVEIYFDLGNKNNKKYYTIVRSHGMRIHDRRINKANQPYTAVVIIQGEKLNEWLSELENAAHDDFVTNDENIDLNIEAVEAYNNIVSLVVNYILDKTNIEVADEQNLEGLGDIITIPGCYTRR